MWGPCFGHKMAISWPFSGKMGLWDRPRIVEFGWEPPWAHWLWFRKNQFEGPCEDHVLAIKGPYFDHFLEKGTMGYTQNCEIWHRASLGTLIRIQKVLLWRNMWGPCLGHKRGILWQFRGLLIYCVVKLKTRHSCRPLVLFLENMFLFWVRVRVKYGITLQWADFRLA